MFFRRDRRKQPKEILPDEVFLDASNLPAMDAEQFEGRMEHPVSHRSVFAIAVIFFFVVIVFGVRLFNLQVVRGEAFAQTSNENRLESSVVFVERGVIYDRAGRELAWNEAGDEAYPLRRYADMAGLSHVVGFVRYPKTDKTGAWWRSEIVGAAGSEQIFDATLAGENGRQLIEVNALDEIIREQLVEPAREGESIELSIDAETQSTLHKILAGHIQRYGFVGAASVIVDIETGELIALVSVPEFDSQILTDGKSSIIGEYAHDKRTPFLNRAISGTYTPGSIVKPAFALGALAEDIISPQKEIISRGFISVPNPYDPDNPTIFRDWRAHGWTDMREAIAVSSDVYFYSIGGGYENQKGLGISLLDTYARLFGMGQETGIILSGEAEGVIPTPEWKEAVFDGDPWRLGDTYITAIGQYGFQVTPLQAAVYAAALANGGALLTPRIEKGAHAEMRDIDVSLEHLRIVQEGMRLAVTSSEGTARALNVQGVPIAAKTGTAQVGNRTQWMHSWVIGFWPFDNPRYAFATVLEKAPAGTSAGAAPAMKTFFEWLVGNKPEYLK